MEFCPGLPIDPAWQYIRTRPDFARHGQSPTVVQRPGRDPSIRCRRRPHNLALHAVQLQRIQMDKRSMIQPGFIGRSLDSWSMYASMKSKKSDHTDLPPNGEAISKK